MHIAVIRPGKKKEILSALVPEKDMIVCLLDEADLKKIVARE
jgi:hypothetical protein